MEGVRYFIWLGSLGITPVWYYSGVTIALLLAILLSFCARLRTLPSFFRWHSLLAFVPLLSALINILLGTFLRPTNANLGGLWPSAMIWLILFLNLPLAIYTVNRMTGFRLVAVTLLLFGLWVAFWCAYYAGMSITGAWYEV